MRLDQRFAQQVSAEPDAAAVSTGSRTFTYGELDEASTGYAAWLTVNGARPGQLVGLEVGRRIETVVAVIGCFKAGVAYVPHSRHWPIARTRSLLRASGASGNYSDDRTITQGLTGGATCDPDLAYVLYTSGTTGTPKGVPIMHRNVGSMLDAALPLFDVSASDVWAMCHLATFDFSVWEQWAALTTGARIELLSDREVMRPRDLRRRVAEGGVTVLSQVPSAFNATLGEHLRARKNGEYRRLRHLVFGGERVDLDDVAAFVDASDQDVTCVNMYGITECSVHATYRRITRDDLRYRDKTSETPIGFTLASHTHAIGEPEVQSDGSVLGELLLSGPAVARSYWRDDDLTENRFSRADDGRGEIWFHSGDLVRQSAAGELTYRHRKDSQLKVMGYRIDASEIEQTARRLPRILACSVFVTAHSGRDRLAAVYTSSGKVAASELRTFLAEHLPSYMVPTIVTRLDTLPLTESGKVDSRRLRELSERPTPGEPAPTGDSTGIA